MDHVGMAVQQATPINTLYSILAFDMILIKIFIEQNQRYILFLF